MRLCKNDYFVGAIFDPSATSLILEATYQISKESCTSSVKHHSETIKNTVMKPTQGLNGVLKPEHNKNKQEHDELIARHRPSETH